MRLRTLVLYALLNTAPLVGYSQTFNHTYELYVEPLGKRVNIGTTSISRKDDSLSARVFVPNEKIDLILNYNISTGEYSNNYRYSKDDQNSYNIFTAYLTFLDSLKNGSIDTLEFDLKISNKPKRVKLIHLKTENNIHTYMLKPSEGGLEIDNSKEIKHLTLECSQEKGIFYIIAKRRFTLGELLTFNFKDGLDVKGLLLENK